LEQRKYFSPKRPVWLPTTNCHVCLIDDWWHISFIFFAIAVAPNFCFSLAAAPQSEVVAVWNKHAPRENPCLSCVKIFVVCFISDARQRGYLPSVFTGRMAKKKRTANKLFAVRLKKTHDKDLVCRAFSPRPTTKYFVPFPTPNKWNMFFKTLPCVLSPDARQTREFAVCFR
jgi:hypothetical protein